MSESRLVAVALTLVVLLLLGLTMQLRLPAHVAPMVVLLPTAMLLLIETARVWLGRLAPPDQPLGAQARAARRTARPVVDPGGLRFRELRYLGWLVGIVAGTLLLGAAIAVPLFLLLWVLMQARRGWPMALAMAVPAALVVAGLLPRALGVRLPSGLVVAAILP